MRSEGTNCLSGPILLSVLVNMPAWPQGFTLLLSLPSKFSHELTGHPLVSSHPPPPIAIFPLPFLYLIINHYLLASLFLPPPSPLICYYPVIKNPILSSLLNCLCPYMFFPSLLFLLLYPKGHKSSLNIS